MIIDEGDTTAAASTAAVTEDESLTLAAEAADRTSSVELVDRDATVSSRPLTSPSGLPLMSLRSTSREWTGEDMLLDWTQLVTVHDLRLLRDFFVEGMTVNVVEQKVFVVGSVLHHITSLAVLVHSATPQIALLSAVVM